MTGSSDYRKYLELQFEGLHKAMNTHAHDTHDRLDTLNGSVKKNQNDIEALRLADALHITTCPVASEVKVIDKKVNDIITTNETKVNSGAKTRGNTMLILMGIGITVSIILGCVGIIKTNKVQTTATHTDGKVDNINTPVKDPRSGKIYMYPVGLLIDSLRKEDSLKYGVK